MKKVHFFVGIYLCMQAITGIVLTIILLFNNRKKSASTALGLSLVSGVFGGLTVYKQISGMLEDSRISRAIDRICADEEYEPVAAEENIPLDETADEEEFCG